MGNGGFSASAVAPIKQTGPHVQPANEAADVLPTIHPDRDAPRQKSRASGAPGARHTCRQAGRERVFPSAASPELHASPRAQGPLTLPVHTRETLLLRFAGRGLLPL